MTPMKAHWYREEANFGDAIAPVILEWITGRPVEWTSRNTKGKVVSTGSLAECIKEGDTVWGTGWHRGYDLKDKAPKNFRPLALRGPLTAEALGIDWADIPFGDPALLLPLIHKPSGYMKRYFLWAPHIADDSDVQFGGQQKVSLRREWRQVVECIAGADGVLSSSLHAIVCAEAYGIPAAWVPCDKVLGGDFKFRDYLLGTGRDPECLKPYEFLPPIPDLEGIQKRLIESGRKI